MALRDDLDRWLGNPVVAGLAVATVGTGAFYLGRYLLGGGSARLPAGVAPPRQTSAPFAELHEQPVWPIQTNHPERGLVSYTDTSGDVHGNWARRFAAPRDGRKHAGVDLYGYNGDPVLAIADGTIVNAQTFHLGTDALLVEHDGLVALYGEVERGSWHDFGVQEGSRVRKGDPIARIGCMQGTPSNCTSHMLHFETYAPGTRQNLQWHGSASPPALRDPTIVLLAAAPAGVNV